MKKYRLLIFIIVVGIFNFFISNNILNKNENSSYSIVSDYSDYNNLSIEQADQELYGVLYLSTLQSVNEKDIEKFIVLNLINIGYNDKQEVLLNAKSIFKVHLLNKNTKNYLFWIFITSSIFIFITILFTFLKRKKQ